MLQQHADAAELEKVAPGHTHFDLVTGADDSDRSWPEQPNVSDAALREDAAALVAAWEMTIPQGAQSCLSQRLKKLVPRLKSVLDQARGRLAGKQPSSELDLLRNRRMLEAVLVSSEADIRNFKDLPHVHIPRRGALPRIANLAEEYLSIAHGVWSVESVTTYVQKVQRHHPLLMDEVLMLPQALRFAQLEFILDRAEETVSEPFIPTAIHSLLRINQYEWNPLLESLIVFDSILRQDPGGTFATMDQETRHAYRKQVSRLARNADFNELETASAGIEMARDAQRLLDGGRADPDPRRAQRLRHVGYYLHAEGLPALKHRIAYHAPFAERVHDFVLCHNDYFYLIGIILLSVLLIVPITAPLVPHHEFWLVMMTLLLALLPVTQGAVDLVNAIFLSFIKTQALPKIDYAKGVPEEATTLVVVPTLLLR